jgi:hypothetical protein
MWRRHRQDLQLKNVAHNTASYQDGIPMNQNDPRNQQSTWNGRRANVRYDQPPDSRHLSINESTKNSQSLRNTADMHQECTGQLYLVGETDPRSGQPQQDKANKPHGTHLNGKGKQPDRSEITTSAKPEDDAQPEDDDQPGTNTEPITGPKNSTNLSNDQPDAHTEKLPEGGNTTLKSKSSDHAGSTQTPVTIGSSDKRSGTPPTRISGYLNGKESDMTEAGKSNASQHETPTPKPRNNKPPGTSERRKNAANFSG